MAKRGKGRFSDSWKFNFKGLNKLLLITLISLVVLLPGCKGKEEQQAGSTIEQQAVSGNSTAEQQERVTSPMPPSQPKVPESLPSEITADTPPKITSVKIAPAIPIIGEQIKAMAETYDKEADPVMLTFHWSINGAELASTGDTLSEGFRRGDRISLTVIPDDGKRTGNPKSLTIIVGNSLPSIQPLQHLPSSQISNGGVYSYQVQANDPDGDPLIYSLKSGPEGMTVDPATGLVKWNVPHGWVGSFPYVVSVTDGNGGEASQNLSVNLTPHK